MRCWPTHPGAEGLVVAAALVAGLRNPIRPGLMLQQLNSSTTEVAAAGTHWLDVCAARPGAADCRR